MCKNVAARPSTWERPLRAFVAVLAVLFIAAAFQISAVAQDQDDPPGRVARLGYMQGSVSFQPAGENEWVEAAPNRPMTTGEKSSWGRPPSTLALTLVLVSSISTTVPFKSSSAPEV
jgi:hypothetical protein